MNSYDLFISELKVPDGMWMCQFLIWQVLLSSWQSVTTASTLSSKWWTYKAKAGILQKETVRAKAAQRTFEEWYYTYVKLRHLHPELAMLKCMFLIKLFQHPRVRSTSRSETAPTAGAAVCAGWPEPRQNHAGQRKLSPSSGAGARPSRGQADVRLPRTRAGASTCPGCRL